ncbi:DUF2934 domain-containing protein [Pseudoruegeria sp. SK021]|uniref:DUF2934 domain-containing protein n=1 Tax=Pseudoruegeria sp. SK021 TaxID=1933035 RepID=UPI000A2638C3|nr:DUF2934 domain-containing protein [Pseudoruegeria sp. SK021]OSP53500.1 hypothetical protein BV911_17730 [Pseudoruegeria sp. SK021]
METTRKDRISQRAYELWEQAGSPEGQAEQFWYQAENELGDGIGDEASAQAFVRDLATPVSEQNPDLAEHDTPAAAKAAPKRPRGKANKDAAS